MSVLFCSTCPNREVYGLKENMLLGANKSRPRVYPHVPLSVPSPLAPGGPCASLTCFFTTKTPPSKVPSLAGRSYQGKDASAAFPPQLFLQEPLLLPHCCRRHRHWSLASGLQEPSKEALGSPCTLNHLSLGRHLAAEGKAAVGWAGSGLSAQVLAMEMSDTPGLLSSFDIPKDPGRECLRKKM